jgi:hypothetical protein
MRSWNYNHAGGASGPRGRFRSAAKSATRLTGGSCLSLKLYPLIGHTADRLEGWHGPYERESRTGCRLSARGNAALLEREMGRWRQPLKMVVRPRRVSGGRRSRRDRLAAVERPGSRCRLRAGRHRRMVRHARVSGDGRRFRRGRAPRGPASRRSSEQRAAVRGPRHHRRRPRRRALRHPRRPGMPARHPADPGRPLRGQHHGEPGCSST